MVKSVVAKKCIFIYMGYYVVTYMLFYNASRQVASFDRLCYWKCYKFLKREVSFNSDAPIGALT